MASKNLSLAVRLQAIDKLSAPLKNVAGASSQAIEALKKTQERLKSVGSQTAQIDAFRQLRQQSKETAQALTQAQSTVSQLAHRMKEAGAPTQALKRELSVAERHVADLAQQMKASGRPSELLVHQFKTAQKEAARLGQAFRRTERENKALSNEFNKAKAHVNQLKQAQQQESATLQQMRQSLAQAGVSTRELSSAQSRARQETAQLTQTLEQQAKKLERIAALESRVAKSKEQLQKSMQLSANLSIAGYGTLQVGKGISNALMGPVSVAADFEEAMSAVGAISGASGEGLQALTASARKLGAETSFSASQSAEGMKYLAMAGFDASQTIAAMPGLLDLAKASGMGEDLGSVADIASDILSGFKLLPSEMGHVSDVLAKTTTTANTDLRLLGETMKYVGPVAEKAGLDLQETAAMAGLLGNVGIKGSQAGTTLRSMLLNLAAPTGAAAKTLEKLGVSTKDSEGNLRSIVEVLGEVAQATDGMGSADQLEALVAIMGKEAATGFQELLGQEGTGGVTKYVDVLRSADGAAAEIAAKMGDNARGKLKELASATESLQISLGNILLPTVKELAVWATTVTRRFEAWSAENPRLTKGLMFAASAIAALALVGGPLILAMASLNAVLAVTRYGMGMFSAVSQLAAARMGTVTAAQWAMNAAMTANPIAITVVALVAAAALIYKYWGPLKAFLSGFWDGFTQALAPVISACSGLSEELGVVGRGFAWVWEQIKALCGWFGQLFQPVEACSETLLRAGENGAQFGRMVGDGIVWATNAAGHLLSAFSAAWDGMKAGALSFWELLKVVFEWSPIGLLMKGLGAGFEWIDKKLGGLTGVATKLKSLFGFDSKGEADVGSSKTLPAIPAALGATLVATSVAAEPVVLPEPYQETVAAYRAPSVSTASVASIPSISSVPAKSAPPSISIGNIEIQVHAAPGMEPNALAQEVRLQLMQLMHEQQARHRGDLYDN